MAKMRSGFKGFILVLILGVGAFAAYRYFGPEKIAKAVAPEGKGAAGTVPASQRVTEQEPVKVCINLWGGFAGGVYMNGGFEPRKDSRFYRDYGLAVKFIRMDDPTQVRPAWRRGECDLMWATVEGISVFVNELMDEEPKVAFFIDWSRGGDLMLAVRDIRTVADLKGRSVIFAGGGAPSHSLLLWLLDAGSLRFGDINPISVSDALKAAEEFKSGNGDAVVLWSPDDGPCMEAVPGSHILKSTREASHIIADTFIIKRNVLDERFGEIAKLVEGWLVGNAEINTSSSAKAEAVRVMTASFGDVDEAFMTIAVNNARLVTYGDNTQFFNLKGTYRGVTGEDLYSRTAELYRQVGEIKGTIPAWRSLMDARILRQINLTGSQHAAEEVAFEKPTPEQASAPALATKGITVNFALNSSVLDNNAKNVIDREVVDIAKGFGFNRFRVEGNTDSTGSREYNVRLSRDRAKAMVDYIVRTYNLDPDKFVWVGNGPDKPVPGCEANDTEMCRAKNRRADFEVLQ